MAHISDSSLKVMRQAELGINRKLFFVVTLITVIVLVVELVRFFSRGAFPPSGLSLLYIGVLLLYSAHKEVTRWLGERKLERHGEYFVYLWVGITLTLYVINFLTYGYYDNFPDGSSRGMLRDLTLITLQVCAIFLFTRVSKAFKLLWTRSNNGK